MKKVLAALAAAGVLIAGGFATAALSTPGTATAQESPADSPNEGTTEDAERPEPGAFLDEVFDELVADGVITQDQAGQVRAALQDALEEKRAELTERFGDRRDHRRGFALRGALEDGVIDADELAELPDGHPLTDPDGPFAEYLDDGQITREELEEFRAERGNGLRAALEDGVIDADELAELPDGHPLTDPDGPFAEYLDDGQITQEELEELRGQFRDRHRGFRGLGGGGPVGGEASTSA